MTIAPTNVLW